MKNESEIRTIFERKLRLFARTGKETYLETAQTLQEILEISDIEECELLEKYLDEYKRG